MTTIYELEKRATPGPLIVQGIEDKRTSTDAVLTAFTPKFRNPRYVGRVYGQGVFSNLCEERDANARLLAHCRNHFLRALEALKKVHKLVDLTVPDLYSQPCVDEMRNEVWAITGPLIAELEEVK